jgi:hypothetical protein
VDKLFPAFTVGGILRRIAVDLGKPILDAPGVLFPKPNAPRETTMHFQATLDADEYLDARYVVQVDLIRAVSPGRRVAITVSLLDDELPAEEQMVKVAPFRG